FWANYAKGKIETKSEAEAIVNSCKGKNGTVEKIETETFLKPPPTPFDLGTLQSEAYRLFGYTPKRTSDIAQSLYLDALISYPRTSSQKLPPNINYRAILSALARFPAYRQPATALLQKTQLTPKEGKATDPAHPAIYPTGTLPTKTLNNAETKILDLIIRRFMAVFADHAIGQNTIVSININGHPFQLSGTQISRRGWLDFYQPYAKTEEAPLPLIKENQPIQVEKVVLENEYTKPPPRYTAASLLRQMEKSGIGTKATRAETIQTIYERKYAKNQNITPTILGFEVHNILEKYCPTITSPLFTRELEEKMDSIMSNEQTRENIIAETISSLKPLLEKLGENEETIGAQLTQAINQMKNEERALGSCPNCKTGTLTILYSRKTGKRFVGCTNYFKGLCKTSFPLPQTGRIRKKEKPCLHCGFPTIQAITATGRAWDFCLNPKCPARRQKEGQAVEM
ncbi:MAG: DNA topoisomerase, partial [Candidatus Bathyarchaeia archaeon]